MKEEYQIDSVRFVSIYLTLYDMRIDGVSVGFYDCNLDTIVFAYVRLKAAMFLNIYTLSLVVRTDYNIYLSKSEKPVNL